MKTKSDYTKFTALFTGLCELFDKKYSQALMSIYTEALGTYDIEQLEYAIKQAAVSCRFFPKPVELIEFISGGKTAIQDRAVSQGAAVLTTVKRVGSYVSVMFHDPVTTAVISASFGGWVKLCNSLNDDDDKWFLKDFEKAYIAFSRQGIAESGVLSGIVDMQNGAKGLDVCSPCVQIEQLKRKEMRPGPKAVTDSSRDITALLPAIGTDIRNI